MPPMLEALTRLGCHQQAQIIHLQVQYTPPRHQRIHPLLLNIHQRRRLDQEVVVLERVGRSILPPPHSIRRRRHNTRQRHRNTRPRHHSIRRRRHSTRQRLRNTLPLLRNTRLHRHSTRRRLRNTHRHRRSTLLHRRNTLLLPLNILRHHLNTPRRLLSILPAEMLALLLLPALHLLVVVE